MLAAINGIETAFGTNLNVSSAGAVGWMQFMPETWDGYGVDANGDGVADPYNPEDAIFAAASYLQRLRRCRPTRYGAIFAYNHADWYVAEVLANAAVLRPLGGALGGAFALTPKLQVLSCDAGEGVARAGPGRLPRCLRGAPPPATTSAAAASGRWPRSPASSRTSAAA